MPSLIVRNLDPNFGGMREFIWFRACLGARIMEGIEGARIIHYSPSILLLFILLTV